MGLALSGLVERTSQVCRMFWSVKTMPWRWGAMGAIRYELGFRVPEDIAVTGFDDVPQASSPHYQLTTYRQPLTEMANALVDVLEGKKRTTTLNAFLGNLIVRKSA